MASEPALPTSSAPPGPPARASLGLLLALLVLGLLLESGKDIPRWFRLHRDGVTVWRVGPEGLPAGRAVQGRSGDLVIASDRVRLVVAAGRELGGVQRAGAIVDAAATDLAADTLREWRATLWRQGPRGAMPIPLRTIGVDAALRRGRPVIVVDQRATTGDLTVETEIDLPRDASHADLAIRVTNRGGARASGVRAGQRVLWPGEPTFAPGLGPVSEPAHSRVEWLGRQGRGLSYVLLPPAPADAGFTFDPHGLAAQDVLGEPFALEPGASRTFRTRLVVARGTLAEAAERAWTLAGVALGRVRGDVQGDAEGAVVEAWRGDGRMILSTSVGGRRTFDLSVPPGRYRLLLRTRGGDDTATVAVTSGAIATATLAAPAPGWLRYAVSDERDRPLPARLIIAGERGTADPNLGPYHLAAGAGNVVHSGTGHGELALPPGRYRVTVTRGVEYDLHEQVVVIGRGRGASLRARLHREVDTAGLVAADLHLHAEPSHDSNVPLADRVVSLLAENIELAAATDHNRVTDYGPAIEALSARGSLAAVPGVEVTPPDGVWGHFNVYPLPPAAEPPPSDLAPDALFAWIRPRHADALIQINHPRLDPAIGYFVLMDLDPSTGRARPGYSADFDCLEILNGMELGRQGALDRTLLDWYALLDRGLRYTATGSSDSHRLIYPGVGYPRTFVAVADDRPEAIEPAAVVAALKGGRALVTTGPLVLPRIGDAGPGDTVSAPNGTARLDVVVRAARWIDVRRLEVVVNGERVVDQTMRPTGRVHRGRFSFELRFDRDSWIVVVARGDRPLDDVLPWVRARPVAVSNPIFVDLDGDGGWRLPAGSAPAPADASGDAPRRGDAPPAATSAPDR